MAKEAFASRNYRLAVEMYERCLKQQQPNFEVLLGYGDSLARCGRIRESIDVYSRCLALGNVPSDKLRHLVNAMLEDLGVPTSNTNNQSSRRVVVIPETASFACPKCEGAMYQPVTLDCGHTFCRVCVEEGESCRVCGQRRLCEDAPQLAQQQQQQVNLETNVLVQRLVEKWWPREAEASAARHEADALMKKGLLNEALERYDLAVQLGEFLIYVFFSTFSSLLSARVKVHKCINRVVLKQRRTTFTRHFFLLLSTNLRALCAFAKVT